MSKSVITDSLLSGIADAIRGKTGGESLLTPAEMITEIEGISVGGGAGTTPEELIHLLVMKMFGSAEYPEPVPLVDFGPVDIIPQYFFARTSTGSQGDGFGGTTNVTKIICPNVTDVGTEAMKCNRVASGDGPAIKEAWFPVCRSFASQACTGWLYAHTLVLGGAVSIASKAFYSFGDALSGAGATLYVNASVQSIGSYAFGDAGTGFQTVYFTGSGTAGSIQSNVFQDQMMGNSNVSDIYVPWSEGAVANAPWGAKNATIHYDTYTEPPTM